MPKYWINTGNKIYGPFDATQLKKLASNGELKPNYKLSTDQERWVTAESVKGLAFKTEQAPLPDLSDLFDEEYAFSPAENAGSPVLLASNSQSIESRAIDTIPSLVAPGLRRAAESTQKLEPATGKWFCKIDDQVLGPLDIKKVRELAAAGSLKQTDLVRRPKQTNWMDAARIRGLFNQPVEEMLLGSRLTLFPSFVTLAGRIFQFSVFVGIASGGMALLSGENGRYTGVFSQPWVQTLGLVFIVLGLLGGCSRILLGRSTSEKIYLRRFKNGSVAVATERFWLFKHLDESQEFGYSWLETSAGEEETSVLSLNGDKVKPIVLIVTNNDAEYREGLMRFQKLTGLECRRG